MNKLGFFFDDVKPRPSQNYFRGAVDSSTAFASSKGGVQ
jgi:hypothetical protein